MINLNKKLQSFAQDKLVIGWQSEERSRIKTSLNHLEKILNHSFTLNETIRFGSYTRNTILPRKYDRRSDVDLMLVFNNDRHTYRPEYYRTKIKEFLDRAYPNSVSKKDKPVVKLELNHIKFDIIPAVVEKDWLTGTDYYIPFNQTRWMKTYPNDINDELKKINVNYGDNIIRSVIRLVKYWNAQNKYVLGSSYLLEKDIVERFYFFRGDLLNTFLSTMESAAGHIEIVARCIDGVHKNAESFFQKRDAYKQFEYLKILIPHLK